MKKIFISILFFTMLLTGINCYALNNDTFSILDLENRFYYIKNDNSLWLIDSGEEHKKIMEDVKSIYCNYVIKQDNSVWRLEKDDIIPVTEIDNVKKIFAGAACTLFIKNDNSLWGMGYNFSGQLGAGEDIEKYDTPVKIMNNVEDAQAGYEHCIILKTDGSVWTVGSNGYGQSGSGKNQGDSYRPVKIIDGMKSVYAGETSSYAVDESNTLYHWGCHYGNKVGGSESDIIYTPEKYVENAESVNSHWGFNLVLKDDGTLWVYGDSADASTGYTCFPSGLTLENLPEKLMDDVHCISQWNDSESHTALLLKNNCELYKFDLIDYGKTPKYVIEKIAEDVKLPLKEEEVNPIAFDDISDKSVEIQVAINSLSKAGIIDGTSDTEFSPDKQITRAEIAALLLRMTARDEKEGNGGFSDVTEGKWYYHTAGASKKRGIIAGFEDNTFRGDEPISNIQLISMVSRALQEEKGTDKSNAFIDLDVPSWSAYDVSTAIDNGLITEKDITNADYMTRGDAAVILYRLYDKI